MWVACKSSVGVPQYTKFEERKEQPAVGTRVLRLPLHIDMSRSFAVSEGVKSRVKSTGIASGNLKP